MSVVVGACNHLPANRLLEFRVEVRLLSRGAATRSSSPTSRGGCRNRVQHRSLWPSRSRTYIDATRTPTSPTRESQRLQQRPGRIPTKAIRGERGLGLEPTSTAPLAGQTHDQDILIALVKVRLPRPLLRHYSVTLVAVSRTVGSRGRRREKRNGYRTAALFGAPCTPRSRPTDRRRRCRHASRSLRSLHGRVCSADTAAFVRADSAPASGTRQGGPSHPDPLSQPLPVI